MGDHDFILLGVTQYEVPIGLVHVWSCRYSGLALVANEATKGRSHPLNQK